MKKKARNEYADLGAGRVAIGILVAAVGWVILVVAGSQFSRPRVNNILNPAWIVEGHVVNLMGQPIADASVTATSLIGSYSIGRILEKGPEKEVENLSVNHSGSFFFKKRAGAVFFEVTHPRWGSQRITLCENIPINGAIRSLKEARYITVVLTGTNQMAEPLGHQVLPTEIPP